MARANCIVYNKPETTRLADCVSQPPTTAVAAFGAPFHRNREHRHGKGGQRILKTAFSFFHSPVFRKFMLSFLAAFMLPISLLFAYLDYNQRDLLTREIYDVQDATVSYMRRTMDFEYARYRTFAAMLMNNADLNRLRRMSYAAMTPADTLRLMNLRGVLSSFAADPSVVSRIFLYMPTSGLYVDAVRALPVADALYTLEDAALLPADDALWQNMLSGVFRSQWFRAVNRRGSQILYYLQSIPSTFGADPCNLMVAINPAYLQDVFNADSLAANEWIGMLSETGTVLYGTQGKEPALDLTLASDNGGHFVANRQLVTYSRSADTRNLYFSVIPLSNISNALSGAQSLSYAVLMICFFICTVITYLITVNNFKPIAFLSALAQPDTEEPDVDEFTRLRITLMEASDEKRMRMDRARYAQDVRDDQRLVQTMLKQNVPAPLEKRLQREQLALVGGAWVLCTVTLIDYPEETTDTQTAFQRSMTQVHDSLSTAMAKFYTVLPLYDDKTLLVLVNLPSNELQHLTYLGASFTNLLHLLRSSFSIDCRIAVSAIHTQTALNGDTLAAMLTEARIAAETPAEGESILYYSTQAVDKVMHISVEHTMHRLMHASMRGAAVETEQLFAQLGEQVRTLAENQSHAEPEADADEDGGTEMRIKRSILEIVKNEYPDPMLNVSAIADKLGKNVDYISRVFKQTTTIGLLDYIHHMRVKAAKDLLVHQPSLSVAQIGERVGYFGADSFIRSFKRIEGVTPGRYRTQNKGV